MYTVTTQNANGMWAVSRYFETVRAARNWVKWLDKQSFCIRIRLYRGQAGEILLEQIEKRIA